jgi:hypothetical protein
MSVLSSSAPLATVTGTLNADTKKQCHLSMDAALEHPTGTQSTSSNPKKAILESKKHAQHVEELGVQIKIFDFATW